MEHDIVILLHNSTMKNSQTNYIVLNFSHNFHFFTIYQNITPYMLQGILPIQLKMIVLHQTVKL